MTRMKAKTKDELIAENAKLETANDKLAREAAARVNELAAAIKSIERLKESLLDEKISNARLNGYKERVNEDDVVREDVLEILPRDMQRNDQLMPTPKRPKPSCVGTFQRARQFAETMWPRHFIRLLRSMRPSKNIWTRTNFGENSGLDSLST